MAYVEECSEINKTRSPLENTATVHLENSMKRADVNKGAEPVKEKKKKAWLQFTESRLPLDL